MDRTRVVAGVASAAVAVGLVVAGVAYVRTPSRLPDDASARAPAATSAPTSAKPTSDSPSPSSSPTPASPSAVPTTGPDRPVGTVAAPALVGSFRTRPGDVPVEVRIPRIGVDSPLVRLGIGADGSLEVPTDFSKAGWFDRGPAPGDRGPAVIVGHVDSTDGPAVFFRLGRLRPGDRVEVVQRDGDVVRFTVRRLVHVAKDRFPTDEVYGPVPGPVLRLVTCSGEIDPVSGHYLDNTVVFAS